MSATWACPYCKRRVPAQYLECRCGARRPAESPAGRPGASAGAPRLFSTNADWLWAFVLLLLFAGSIAYAMYSRPAPPLPPILGVLDPPRPSPSPAGRTVGASAVSRAPAPATDKK